MSGAASATPIAPGQTVTPGLTGGTFNTLATTGPTNFNFFGDAGTVAESVGQFSANPFGANDMTFLYQFNVTSGVIQTITGADFSGFSLDVATSPGTLPLGLGTVAPVSASLDAAGRVVSFYFGTTGVLPGQMSYTLVVNTNATNYTNGVLSLQDGGAGSFPGFQPAAAPEFGSASLMGLMLVGFGGIYGLRRFRMPAMA
jgi:hypothetical protein